MTRRLMLVVLVLLGLMVLVVTVAPPDRGVQSGSTPTSKPGSQPVSDPYAFDVSETLQTDAEGVSIDAEIGDMVQILVEGTEPTSVALGDLRVEQLEAGIPARFEFLAETTGAYPLILVDENRQIGTLEIR